MFIDLIIILTGVRRIGKTSLLLVALHESKIPYIILDARKLRENYALKDLYSLLSEALSSSLDKLKDVLRKIRGISIMGNYVEISWRGRSYVSLADLFDHLNEKRIIIAIDEAQRLRGPLSKEIKNAIAHAYDYDRNLTFILTGSEIGLLHDFLDVEDNSSPLYSRYCYEIKLERFKESLSKEFLKRGFEEFKLKVDDAVVSEIVKTFDGIPGWLTLAGNYYLARRSVEQVKEMSIRLAVNEIENLIESKRKISEITSRRYREALKCISEGANSWSKLHECVSEKEGTTISYSVLDNILRQLENMSIISSYEFLDPVYKEA
ncbi:ATP-binding protein [Sulfolobus tengchongensis]|uniref:ATP-binding protein n=1 Tax=Sulfolobus tengchongensis TaxID=207809 RepID=A0AAX4L3J4_9CREN